MKTDTQKRYQIVNQINREAVREKTNIDALWKLIDKLIDWELDHAIITQFDEEEE